MTEPASRRPLLVLGDDGGPPSDTAWRWVTNQTWPGWHVDVLTAAPEEVPIEWGAPPAVSEWTPPWNRTEAVEGSADVRFRQVATDPRAMLAELEDLDLIVLGLRTHSYLRALVTGSTTEWVLHNPPAPLVVAAQPDPVHSATICVDGSGHARRAMEAFTSLPFTADAAVTILAVDDGRTDARAGAESAHAILEAKVASTETVITEGSPTPTILSHLEDRRPDLVVLGTRGLTGWQRLRLGSTASAVVRSAPCSSLVASTDMGKAR